MRAVTSRAVLAAGVLVAVAAGCGDDDSSSAAFCDGAEAFLDGGVGLDDPASAAGREAIAKAQRLDAPEPIRADWTTLVDGAQVLADSSGDLSPDDEHAVQEMAAASSDVFAYLEEECDLTI